MNLPPVGVVVLALPVDLVFLALKFAKTKKEAGNSWTNHVRVNVAVASHLVGLCTPWTPQFISYSNHKFILICKISMKKQGKTKANTSGK